MTAQYLLTSRDYAGFEPPLAYDVVRQARVSRGNGAVLIKLHGACDLSDYGLSDQERFLIIAARHKDTGIRDVEGGETLSVYIYHARKTFFGGRSARARSKDLIAWGEVFCEDAD